MFKRPVALVAALSVALGAAALAAQRPGSQGAAPGQRSPAAQARTPTRQATATAVISGRVMAADTGRPVKRARVFAVAAELPDGRSATAAEDGSYEIADLPPGRYTVGASKTGFAALSYGQRRPLRPGTPIQLKDGERLKGIDFALPRGSVITGHVYDEGGEPIARVSVRVLRSMYAQGQRMLVPAGSDQSDDRGEYRVYGLPPGNYFVSAVAPPADGGRGGSGGMFGGGGPGGPGMYGGGRGGGWFAREESGDEGASTVAFAPTYYPGVPNLAEATPVIAPIGQEVGGVDFMLLLVRMARVSGSVISPDGGRVTSGRVMIMPEDTRSRYGGSTYGGRIDSDGTFTVTRVPPGRYVIGALANSTRSSINMYGAQPLTVGDQDVPGVSLSLAQGGSIAGTVSFESAGGTPAPTDLTDIRLTCLTQGPQQLGITPSTRVEFNGSFEIEDIPAGACLLRVAGAPRAWVLKSVQADGRDATDTEVDVRAGRRITGARVVFTDSATHLTGTVESDSGDTLTDYTVVAFSTDNAYWTAQSRRVKVVRPDQTGQFQVDGLPPGSYYLAVVDDVDEGEWYEPSFLQQLQANAIQVSLGEGETKNQALKVKGGSGDDN